MNQFGFDLNKHLNAIDRQEQLDNELIEELKDDLIWRLQDVLQECADNFTRTLNAKEQRVMKEVTFYVK